MILYIYMYIYDIIYIYVCILIDRRLTDSRSLVDECISLSIRCTALGFARLALPFGAARRSRGPSDGGTQNYPQLFMVVVKPGLINHGLFKLLGVLLQ